MPQPWLAVGNTMSNLIAGLKPLRVRNKRDTAGPTVRYQAEMIIAKCLIQRHSNVTKVWIEPTQGRI